MPYKVVATISDGRKSVRKTYVVGSRNDIASIRKQIRINMRKLKIPMNNLSMKITKRER